MRGRGHWVHGGETKASMKPWWNEQNCRNKNWSLQLILDEKLFRSSLDRWIFREKKILFARSKIASRLNLSKWSKFWGNNLWARFCKYLRKFKLHPSLGPLGRLVLMQTFCCYSLNVLSYFLDSIFTSCQKESNRRRLGVKRKRYLVVIPSPSLTDLSKMREAWSRTHDHLLDELIMNELYRLTTVRSRMNVGSN